MKGASDPQAQMWVQDTIQTAKDQDLGRELLLSLADEVGVWKLLIVGVLVVMATILMPIWAAVRFIRKRGGG